MAVRPKHGWPEPGVKAFAPLAEADPARTDAREMQLALQARRPRLAPRLVWTSINCAHVSVSVSV